MFQYFLVINVAVGGVSAYFGEHLRNEKGEKPWNNTSGKSAHEFWQAKDVWFPTWEGNNGTLQVDYVRIYAV